jgi:hypothetical protein
MERSRALNVTASYTVSAYYSIKTSRCGKLIWLQSIKDAGCIPKCARAARAVGSDYAIHGASFSRQQLCRIGRRKSANLRYETVSLSEYLVAELLSPVGGTALSLTCRNRNTPACFSAMASASALARSIGQWRLVGNALSIRTFGLRLRAGRILCLVEWSTGEQRSGAASCVGRDEIPKSRHSTQSFFK